MARRSKKKVARRSLRRAARRARGQRAKRKKTKAIASSAQPAGRLSRQALSRQKAQEKFTDPRVTQQLKTYETGVKHFHHQKFDRARELFEKAISGPSRELAERAQVHLNICRQKVTRVTVQLKSADDHYYYAVSMINMGRYEEAHNHLKRAQRAAPKADYIHYALATLSSLTGDTEASLEHLRRAIELRPENRFHARYDTDFDVLREDPRFTELIYPERDMPS